MNKRYIVLFVCLLTALPSFADDLFEPHEIVCFDDLNTNSEVDMGEMIRCGVTDEDEDYDTTHDQDNICTHDMLDCQPRYIHPECPTGSTLNGDEDYCHAEVSRECPTGYDYDSANDDCVESSPPAGDPPDVQPVDLVCPDGMVYSSDIDACSAFPNCYIDGIMGVYLPEGYGGSYRDMCFMGHFCPYSDTVPCKRYLGTLRCSQIPCVPYQDAYDDEASVEEGEADQTNDGRRASDGTCLDNLYIFPGRDIRCRKNGITVGYQDCCTDTDYYSIIWINSAWLLWRSHCDPTEETLIKLKTDGLCHYVGEYCSKRLKTFFGSICFEWKKSYCCFNNKLARIIHEQGRPQLRRFQLNTWGEASEPLCTGFTPELLQNIDFSQIDLSEFYSDIEVTDNVTIMHDMVGQIGSSVSTARGSGP